MTERKELIATLERINDAIKKHRYLAGWGNVESKQRLRELRVRKKEILNELKNLQEI